MASVGLPFVIAELRDRDALERARPDITGLEGLVAEGFEQPDVHLYVRTSDGFDIRARMFSPLDGIPEDPATGSANCALVGLLSHLDEAANGAFSWRISQGVEMGRPSVLEARAEKRDGAVVNVWIGGECVLVSEGLIDVRRQRRPTSRQPPDLLIVVSSTSSPTPSGASGLVDANLALVSSVSSVSRRSGQGT